jgi:hypothetical protein
MRSAVLWGFSEKEILAEERVRKRYSEGQVLANATGQQGGAIGYFVFGCLCQGAPGFEPEYRRTANAPKVAVSVLLHSQRAISITSMQFGMTNKYRSSREFVVQRFFDGLRARVSDRYHAYGHFTKVWQSSEGTCCHASAITQVDAPVSSPKKRCSYTSEAMLA